MSDIRDSDRIKKHLCGSIIFAAVLLAIVFWFANFTDVRRAIARSSPWGPLAYVIIKAATYIAAPLSSLPLQVAAGAAFGVWPAALYTLAGCAIGGSINFCIGRFLARPVLIRMIGDRRASNLDDLARRFGAWPELLLARVFLSPIYDFISYAAGLTRLSYLHYFLVSIFGGIVPTLVWAALGASFTGGSLAWLAGSAGAAFFLLLSLFFGKHRTSSN